MATTENVTSNSVTADDSGLITVVVRGLQTEDAVRGLMRSLSDQISTLRAQNTSKILLLFDVSGLTIKDTTKEGRTAGRKLGSILKVDAIAIVGNTQLLTLLTYIARASRPGYHVSYFRSYPKALKWLRGEQMQQSRSSASLISGVLVAGIGIAGLAGWLFSNDYLRSFIPSLRPINPIAALALLLISFGFFMYWSKSSKALRLGSVVIAILGIAALLPLNIDTILFGDKVIAYGSHAGLADSAAICFILLGIIGFIARRPYRWVQPVETLIIGAVLGLSLFNIYGQLYAHDFIYSISDSFVMAFNLAVALVITAVGQGVLVIYKRMGSVTNRVSKVGWLMIIAIIGLQIATYANWNETSKRNDAEAQQSFISESTDIQESVTGRLQAYTDALHGFGGLFAASDNVTEGDFTAYYNELDLVKNYPGLRSIAYISVVKDSDIPAFVAARRNDKSIDPKGNPNFTVLSKTSAPVHYIATYSVNSTSRAALGLDLTSVAGRAETYGTAVTSGKSHASGSVTFPTTTTDDRYGFFITMPVRLANMTRASGLVNANFSYKDFFASILTQYESQKDLNLSIIDEVSGETLYSSKKVNGTTPLTSALPMQVADRTWIIKTAAASTFATQTGQQRLPDAILIIGQLFSLLLVGIFVSQARARKQALDLADVATQDLQYERKHILELNKKDEAILTSIGEGIVVLDKHGKIEFVNTTATKILGYEARELIGEKFTTKIDATLESGTPISPSKRPADIALHSKKVVSSILYYERKNGERFPVRITTAPIIVGDKIIGIIEVFRDITEEYALDKAKGEFVSLASHQLRTPLSAVNWYAEMLINGDAGPINKDQASYLREIYEGNQRMIELVNALLDVSRIELGRLVNQAQPTDVVAIANDIQKEMAPMISTKNLSVHADLQASLPQVDGDPKLLRMIVQNLVSNAVKYTPDKGTVSIALRSAKQKEVEGAHISRSGDYIYLSVKDSGYGIPTEQRAHIFEKLFRADNVRKLDVEGTGLGLYIVKQVVENMGGKVWFESTESVGTTFYVILPLKTLGAKKIDKQ